MSVHRPIAAAARPGRYISPLRYPGGKARLTRWLAELFTTQHSAMDIEIWVEPFAGGAGAGLTLLANQHVQEVWLAEKNPALAAMWRTLINESGWLASQVRTLRPTMTQFLASRELVAAADHDPAAGTDRDLALAALILNRCSRSGIVSATVGPIGGRQQNGRWALTDRFNPTGLADRIEALTPLMNRVRFLGHDGISHIAELDGTVGIEDEMVIFADPPYIRDGQRLYAHPFTPTHHAALAAALNQCAAHWLLTYDRHPEIFDRLYRHRRVLSVAMTHTANRSHRDHEYLVVSPWFAISPDTAADYNVHARWVRDTDHSWDGAPHQPPLFATP